MTGAMVGSSFLSRVMVFIDGHYLEKKIRDKKISDKLDEGLKIKQKGEAYNRN